MPKTKPKPEDLFTTRQLQVAQGLAMGWSESEIALDLGISRRTVKSHCDNLRLILGVPRRRLIPAAMRSKYGLDPMNFPC